MALRLIKTTIKFAVFCLLLAFLVGLAIFAYFVKDLPDPTKISQREIIESTKIYDRTGQTILYDIHGEERRTILPFQEIPQTVKDATVVIEDDNFYHHIGLDWQGVLRAVWANLRGQRIAQGGSTITQQFIKNAYLGGPESERTFSRKIKEVILALVLERKYSKDEILSFYLNQVPYGSNAYGIEAASQTFFNKPAKELSLGQAVLLAALPKAPSYYSPYGAHPEELKARQEYILDRMVKFSYLNQEAADQAKQEALEYGSQADLRAHHFVTMVQEYLEEKYGRDYTDINMAGLKVYTTLDWALQKTAEEVILAGVTKNEKQYRASNAALVAIDPKSGQVLALVGSKNYQEDQFNVAISPYRQPGSSFKPFAYAAAFKKGFQPETIIFDLPTNFGPAGPAGEDYQPQNYDLKFRGPITFRQALAQSINVASVKVLYLAGVNETINLAQDMGITTLKDRRRYGLSLVLGGGEVRLIDEVAAYGVFATEGIRHPLSLILKIENNQGETLEEYQDEPIQVLEPGVARQINNILTDEAARAPIFGNHSKLYLPDRPAAVKTGTTQDYSDGWTVGYTPSLAVGVWAGNNDYAKKMKPGADGVYVAAPIWHDFMEKAYQNKAKAQTEKEGRPESPWDAQKTEPENERNTFYLPQEIEDFTPPSPSATSTKPMLGGQLAYQRRVKIDRVSGKLATPLTPPDLIQETLYQEIHTILYYVDKNDPLADLPEDPSQDPQFAKWEESVTAWANKQPCSYGVCYNQNPPSQYDDVHTQENQPEIEIVSPQPDEEMSQKTLTIQAQAQAKLGVKQLDFFFNNQLVGSDSNLPYLVTFDPSVYLVSGTRQTIKVIAYDEALNRQEEEIYINYQKD